jgi:hypothetical protein
MSLLKHADYEAVQAKLEDGQVRLLVERGCLLEFTYFHNYRGKILPVILFSLILKMMNIMESLFLQYMIPFNGLL